MRMLDSLTETDPKFILGYQCAIDDLKLIFNLAKTFNPKMDIIGLVEDWEIIIAEAQKKVLGKTNN